MSSAVLPSAEPHLAETSAVWLVPTWAWPVRVKSRAQSLTAPASRVDDGGGLLAQRWWPPPGAPSGQRPPPASALRCGEGRNAERPKTVKHTSSSLEI